MPAPYRYPRFKSKPATPKSPSRWDVWLLRVGHISQFGLLVATAAAFFYTVVPLYQKAVLEEAIARKEVELKAANKTLDDSYFLIFTYTLNAYTFDTGPRCTGLLKPPEPLELLGGPRKERPMPVVEFREDDVAKCLRASLDQWEGGLGRLREGDRRRLAAEVEKLAVELGQEQKRVLEKIEGTADRVKQSPAAKALIASEANLWASMGMSAEKATRTATDSVIRNSQKTTIDEFWKHAGKAIRRLMEIELNRKLDESQRGHSH